MFEQTVKKIVDHQISTGSLKEEDRNVYLYGYQMLFEFCVNIVASILIAIIFDSYAIVTIFTIAFLMIRGYVGGYHAKSSIGCFCVSAGMLIVATVLVRYIGDRDIGRWMFLSEIVVLPYIFRNTPILVVSKPITENERVYFNKKIKQIYTAQFFVELVFLFCQKTMWALSVLAVHWTLFFMALTETIHNKRKKDKRCV